jgi:hypothetical protein
LTDEELAIIESHRAEKREEKQRQRFWADAYDRTKKCTECLKNNDKVFHLDLSLVREAKKDGLCGHCYNRTQKQCHATGKNGMRCRNIHKPNELFCSQHN